MAKNFKMRGVDDGLPAPGYTTWVVQGSPDFDASEANPVGTIDTDTVVVVSEFIDEVGGAVSSVTKVAATFDTGEHVIITGATDFEFSHTDAFSWGAWILTTNQADIGVVGNLTTGGKGWEFYKASSGFALLQIINAHGSGIALDSNPITIDDGKLHFICCTYDGSNTATGTILYIDGSDVSNIVLSNTLTDIVSTEDVRIGERPNGTLDYSGDLNDISIWDKGLSADEVNTIYNNGAPPDLSVIGPTANLVGWWGLDDSSKTISPDVITDKSTGGNDGDITGTLSYVSRMYLL